MIKAGEFDKDVTIRDRISKIDVIGNLLKSLDLSTLRIINQSIIKKANRSKVLAGGNIDGYTVAAIDGTNLFNTSITYSIIKKDM